jgi:radical SAM superfamily enzyme YgiQ (UPF0313 family)
MSARIDCLFIHCPKFNNRYRPIDDHMFATLIPMGVFALCELLCRMGFPSRILHLGVEWIENREFSLLDYLEDLKPRVVAMDLHWHHQSSDVIQTARRMKDRFPGIFLLLGGTTASFYHQEILENETSIDAIIRGEGEIPIVSLMEGLRTGRRNFGEIPNLSWRNGSEVITNSLSYVASREMLDDLNFTRFDLLKNHPTYVRYMGLPFYVKGVSKEKNFWMYSLKSPMFDLEVGRGCPVTCTWCGGSHSSQEKISGRKHVIFRSPERVLQSIEEALSYGYETMHICFDPFPQKPDYYLALFSRIRNMGLSVECFYESFGLPNPEFIREFAMTFPGTKSLVGLSPEVGSERVRRTNKGYFYTNAQLMETLHLMQNEGVYADLFFTYGVAGETERDLRETLDLIKRVKRFPNVRGIRSFAVEMEPGAPWHVNPDAYGIETSLQRFEDYVRHHADDNHDPFASLGYTIPGFFEGDHSEGDSFAHRIQRFKCRHLCFIHPNARKTSSPFWGRMLCRASQVAWWIKKRITPHSTRINRGNP